MRQQIYRMYAADGTLLYLGVSISAMQRLYQHRTDKEWWDDVVRIDIEHLRCTRAEALEREAAAIKAECPEFNVAHRPRRHEPLEPTAPSGMSTLDELRLVAKEAAEARRSRDQAIAASHAEGDSLREIARVVGLSPAAVARITARTVVCQAEPTPKTELESPQ